MSETVQERLNEAVIADGQTLRRCRWLFADPVHREATIRVAAVGLCRTDLSVMDGTIPVRRPIIPGHEFSGVVDAVGTGVDSLLVGDRVAVNPVIPCGDCSFCCSNQSMDCQATRFLGVDLDGACCSFATVPASSVVSISNDLPFECAAFAEPVAASLAVLKSGIQPQNTGIIAGDNRIARLTLRVLQAHGFQSVEVCDADDLVGLPANRLDFAIETLATPDVLTELVRIIRPRGRIVLKSRQTRAVPLTFSELLPKEPVLHAVNYGDFGEAVSLLASGRVDVSDLIGDRFPLSRIDEAIAAARRDESRKTFLLPAGDV